MAEAVGVKVVGRHHSVGDKDPPFLIDMTSVRQVLPETGEMDEKGKHKDQRSHKDWESRSFGVAADGLFASPHRGWPLTTNSYARLHCRPPPARIGCNSHRRDLRAGAPKSCSVAHYPN